LVELKPASSKGEPDTIVNGAATLATPLLNVAPPELVTTKATCALAPTATAPKLMLVGKTPICGAVKPTPVTPFVLFPPEVLNTTTLLKLPELTGETDT